MLGILAKRRAGPSKANLVTCSTCFIRWRSGSVLPHTLKNCGRARQHRLL